MGNRSIKIIFVFSVMAGGWAASIVYPVTARQDSPNARDSQKSQQELFGPSNARTEDGRLIPVEHFIPASRCLNCHQDTHAAWSESLHRNAAREPFYRESADILLKTRGIELTRHCESCHTPVALFSGALTKDAKKQEAPFTPLDNEGLTCSVCHSITEAKLNGTGSYTIRRPALLAREDGSPVYGDFTDEQILADVPGHKRAVMRPLMRTPEFCSTCHKVDAPPALNGYKHIRGFSAYDEWQQSGASHESVLPFYRREERVECRTCHMPRIPSANDRAAKEGKIASHRWFGANTAAPLFYGQTSQVNGISEFLKTMVLEADIFTLRRDSANQAVAPLGAENEILLKPGEEVTVDVVVSNRNAAHSFPPEVRDLYEAWVEFEALNPSGRRIFHSGFVKADQMLDEGAHVYKQIILDQEGRQITRHQIWTTNIKAYDNTINAGRSDVVRFRFQVPDCRVRSADCGPEEPAKNRSRRTRAKATPAARQKPSSATAQLDFLKLRVRVNYRRLNQEYTNYVLQRQRKKLEMPIVRMAQTESILLLNPEVGGKADPAVASASKNPDWKRWNDYGIGLLEQAQYGMASAAFRRAAELNPSDPNLLVNAAISELKTERYAHQERPQLDKAADLINQALIRSPDSLRARYYRALIRRAEGRIAEAAEELSAIAKVYPRDREVHRQLAQTLYTLGRYKESLSGFERILQIDPTDFGAYQFLSSLYLSEGRKVDADRANSLYLLWRDDPKADGIAARFFAAHPEWTDERVSSHVHVQAGLKRPVLTGQSAVPDR